MHSHRLSLAGASETSANQLEEHEKPYDAPMMRIFGLNKPEWPYNIIGNDRHRVNSHRETDFIVRCTVDKILSGWGAISSTKKGG